MKDPASAGNNSASRKWHTRAWSALKVAILGLTLEPAILSSNFGRHIVEGNALNLDLLMEKLCVDRFNETQEVCSNLADYPELQDEVQISYNQFETGKKLVGMVPLVLYSLVAGALSDKYGRKPIFIVALFGRMFEAAVEFVFYVFKDDISIYFWYCTAIFEFLGGMPMYYLGKTGDKYLRSVRMLCNLMASSRYAQLRSHRRNARDANHADESIRGGGQAFAALGDILLELRHQRFRKSRQLRHQVLCTRPLHSLCYLCRPRTASEDKEFGVSKYRGRNELLAQIRRQRQDLHMEAADRDEGYVVHETLQELADAHIHTGWFN